MVSPTLITLATLSLVIPAFAVPPYGQCGGTGYTGSTQCDPGYTCVKLNDWYSQCQPGGASTTAAPTTTTPSVPTTIVPTPTPTTTSTSGPVPSSNPLMSIPAGTMTPLRNFGTNPTNIGMNVYRPTNVKGPNPALLVALHYCGGTAQAYFSGTQFRALADQRGFVVLYGQAPNDMNCWDITSRASLTHNGGSDSLGIANAVRYAISNWNVDPEKVFVVGTSSGAMMVNVLSGAYPDLFKGGAAFAGSALGCLTANMPQFPMDDCQAGRKNQTAQVWGDRAREAYPGYTGPYPRLQFWHGTADTALNYNNLAEEIKQWTNVHGISQTATSVQQNTPRNNWTKSVYGTGQVQGFSGQGAGHGLPESGSGQEAVALDFFGLV
ncbi:hypothetical protein H1R20_g9055, partial [Candolleomyces eurysporus]